MARMRINPAPMPVMPIIEVKPITGRQETIAALGRSFRPLMSVWALIPMAAIGIVGLGLLAPHKTHTPPAVAVSNLPPLPPSDRGWTEAEIQESERRNGPMTPRVRAAMAMPFWEAEKYWDELERRGED